MSRRRGVFNGVKENVGRTVRGDVLAHRLHGSCMVKERLPPRLNVRGISLATRAVCNQIRTFKRNRTANAVSSNVGSSNVGVATTFEVTSSGAPCYLDDDISSKRFKIFNIASCLSTNFAKSLTPEGADLIDGDSGFNKNIPYNLVVKCHNDCNYSSANLKLSPLATCEEKLPTPCRCDGTAINAEDFRSFRGCWEHKGIKEEDLNSFLIENKSFFRKPKKLQQMKETAEELSEWNEFIRNQQCTVFRKQLPSGIYEYRILSSFADISAKSLFKTQLDNDYRKKWDHYIVDLQIKDADPMSSCELIHWVTKCPYPFATREYIYLRKAKVDDENKAMILIQKVTDETDIPKDPKIMRVDTYLSKLIIKPHGEDYDQKGCDYLLSYYDDPKMMLPTRVMDLAASKGIADSVKRMHKAALELEQSDD